MTIADVKALVEGETQISSSIQHLFPPDTLSKPPQERHSLENSKTLQQLSLKEGDVLIMIARDPAQNTDRRRRGGQPVTQSGSQAQQRPNRGPDVEQLRLQALGNPAVMNSLHQHDPNLAEAANDRERFHATMEAFQRRQAEIETEKEAKLALLNADPMNADAQREIAEMIRKEHVNENIQKALEEHPEVFGHVTMLYIPVVINGQHVKAFVDSGAQTTIMSPGCAERCKISYLIDSRFSGIARGVGTAKILGRVHSAEIQIGNYGLSCSFTVMEGKDVELLLGLDMLKRHQMSIDLMKNCLRIQTEEVQFLGEADIPKMEAEKLAEEPTVEGPGGTKIGAKSGAIHSVGERSTPPEQSQSQAQAPSSSASSSAAPPSATQAPQNAAAANNLSAAQKREYLQNVLRNRFSGQSSASASIASPSPVTTQSTPPQPQSQPPPNPPPQPQAPIVAQASIARITELGYSTEEATWALQQANGDVDLA
ncbi:MAG: hypothetical protein Q9160_004309, partial [Pyrenula sp. 1 TL-2023]